MLYTQNIEIMDKKDIFYPDFNYAAPQLSAFSLCIDIFIISLQNGDIIRFKPPDITNFGDWLIANGVRDIAVDDGITSKQQPEPHVSLKSKRKTKWV